MWGQVCVHFKRYANAHLVVEFVQQGEEGTWVRHLLGHQADCNLCEGRPPKWGREDFWDNASERRVGEKLARFWHVDS